MIPRAAVKAFLARPRDDLRKYKKLRDSELVRRMRELPIQPPVWWKLLRDQRVLFLACVMYRRFAVWADTGIGKTLLSMALARYFRAAGVARRFLVLVPNKINLGEWAAEREKHCPKTSFIVLEGSSAAKWDQLRSAKPLMTVATYGGLVRMVSRVQKVKRKRGGRVVHEDKLTPQKKLVREIVDAFDGVILDETSADQAVQYRDSLAWRICNQLSKKMVAKDLPFFDLSGTPFGRDPTPLWAQMFLVDRGASLGETLGLFRAAFFSEKQNYWGGSEFKFKDKMSGVLHRTLAHRSLTIEADEATLPPVVPIRKDIVLPREAADYCEVAKKAILAARGNYQETKNAFLRGRQISSGFLGYSDDETGARAKFIFDENPKLDSLISFIESVAGKYKVVVFHEFILSGDLIGAELDRLKIGYARLGSGAKSTPAEAGRAFRTSDKCRVMLNSNSMVMGPNWQIAKYAAFYESPIDPKKRKQARRRVERQHSTHDRIFIVDFVVKGTFDQKILDHLEEGDNLFDAIVRGRSEL